MVLKFGICLVTKWNYNQTMRSKCWIGFHAIYTKPTDTGKSTVIDSIFKGLCFT